LVYGTCFCVGLDLLAVCLFSLVWLANPLIVVLFLSFATLDHDEAGIAEELYYNSCLFHVPEQDRTQGKPISKFSLSYSHYNGMHVFLAILLSKGKNPIFAALLRGNIYIHGLYYYYSINPNFRKCQS
jgi:hypothetical protein